MATAYKDFRKATDELLYNAFPLDDKTHDARDEFSVSIKTTSAEGVEVSSKFEQTTDADGTDSHGSAQLKHECKKHGVGLTGGVDTDRQTVTGSLWFGENFVQGGKVQVDVKCQKGKDDPNANQLVVGVPITFKNDKLNFRLKPEFGAVGKETQPSAEVQIAGKHDAISAGVGLKLKLGGSAGIIDNGSLSVAHSGDNSTLVAGVDALTQKKSTALSYQANFSWWHRFCGGCDAQYGVSAKLPLSVILPGPPTDLSVTAGASFKPNTDTTISAHIDNNLNVGLAAEVVVNKNFTIAGSSYFAVSDFTNPKSRVVGLSVELSD